MVVLTCVGICLSVRSGRSKPTVPAAVLDYPGQAAATERDPSRQLHVLAVGTWQDFYEGKRTLTLRPDGTATMVVELTGLKARLFTRRLELDIVWSIEDGKMRRRTVGGRPADKVAFVNKMAGVAVAEQILELTADRMILLDQNETRRYSWQRVR